jgi:hypothetical protein
MRKLRTARDLLARGWTRERIRSEVRRGVITPIIKGVYGAGAEHPCELDVVRATALVTNGVADAVATAHLHDLDGAERWWPRVLVANGRSSKRPYVRRVTRLPETTDALAQVRCLTPADTLLGLAAVLDDAHYEQAFEDALRRKLVTPAEAESWSHPRVRRVMRLRGGLLVPATESLLETLAVQLIRRDRSIPTPTRQFTIYDEDGNFVGRPDLSWPELGIFLELDGQQHKDQPVYDAVRQTRIVIATGWLPGRLTWDEVNDHPLATLRSIAKLVRVPSKVS